MWDLEELEHKLKEFKRKLEMECTKSQEQSLILDICKLEELISFRKDTDLKTEAKIKTDIYYQNLNKYTKDNVAQILQNDYRFLYDLNTNQKIKYPLFLHKNKVTSDKFSDIIFEFLISYDPSLYNLLDELLKKNKVYFCNKQNKIYSAVGEEYYLPTDGSHYIAFLYKNKLINGRIILHELVHAHQTDKRESNEYLKLFFSLFLETYSKFIEYVYADYLKEKGYKTIAASITASLIDEFNILVEYYFDIFLNLQSLNYENGKFYNSSGCISYKNIRNFYSDLLAMYFIMEYRKDKEKGFELIKDFDKKVGRVDDRELLEEYNNEILKNGYNSCVKHYYQQY